MPFFRLGKRSQQYNVANKDLFVIPIELLTNECIECTLFAISIGQECLNNVCQKIGLQQSEYFCLLFKSRKHVDQWVDLTKPLKKQLDKYAVEVKLYFRLQYFVPNFHFLTDEISRYHYFCAMKGLVIDGRISSSRDDAILLASFSLQAEFGDYSSERHTVEYLNNFALFPKSMVTSKPARDVLVECAINAYRNLQGVPTNVAEIYYISEAQQRDGYGQEGFPAKDVDTGQDVCLGVCIRGIFVINTDLNTVELFKWNDIANLMHNKKLFTIQRNLESYSKSYSTFDGDFASCIWRTCVEQHQLFMKGIQSTAEADFANEQLNRNIAGLHFLQGKDPFNGDHFLTKGSAIATATNEHTNSLYETINKHASSPSPKYQLGRFESDNNVQQEYNLNGCLEKKVEFLKKRSSTEPIDLHHITLNCANGIQNFKTENNGGLPFTQKVQAKTVSSTSSPLAKSSSNTPIYENQLNSSDLTYEQRKKLLPPYRSPPDYETFIKRKYSANLSQSLSSIPSRLASHSKNSTSSASSLVNPFQNAATFTNGTRNVMFLSSSTQSVPFLVQQRPQPFLSNIYNNFNDLSTLDIEKQTQVIAQSNNHGTDSNMIVPTHSTPMAHLQYQQEQQMQSSALHTASSPELNNLNLFQKRNVQAKAEQAKSNGIARHFESNNDSNLKKRLHFPFHFTSVPDLTFQNTHRQQIISEMNGDYKKFIPQQASKSKSGFLGFAGKNLRIFRSQNNTGSEPNLSNEFDPNSNCYNMPRSKLSMEHFNSLAQKRNSINMLEPQPRHVFSYSISGKIDEAPELSSRIESNEYISSDITFKSSLPPPPPSLEYSNNSSSLHQHKQNVIYANLNSSQATNHTANVPMPTYNNNNNNTNNNNEQPGAKRIDPVSNQSLHPQMDNSSSSSVKSNMYTSNATNNAHHLYEINQPPRHSETVKVMEKKTSDQSSIIFNSLDQMHSFNATTNIPKNSRIIVFDKSFEDQDFTREFELLPRMNPTAKFTTASMNDNILKNRFRDILPYEENRVKLTPTKENKHGYINASHIHMTFGSMKQHYIAAQGPLPTTTLDFWQMVYEQNIHLIVMVTNFTETGVQKCYTYLPLSNEPNKNTIRFGDYEIVCNYTSILPTYITSSLTLNYNGHKRNVTHIRYTDWNDHSIPGDLQGFLSFLSEMDAIYRRNDRDGSFGKKRSASHSPSPILVHCSAGAGRSGVVILCDALLKCLDHNFSEPIDIPRALIQLRFQRMISVQHCEQFRFVCQVLSQYLANSRLI